MTSILRDAAHKLGIDLDDEAMRRLEVYRDLIASAAERFNLTAVRDPAAIEQRHLVESLALGVILGRDGLLEAQSRVLDIGSGAGLPGIPVKIARPDLQMTLLDATGKKCEFLRQAIAVIELEGAFVLEGRAETLGGEPGHRAAYDLVLARAVAPLPVLLEYALPFLRVGGRLAATKGSAADSELAQSGYALTELGGRIESVSPFEPPEALAQVLIVFEKVGETPERYPRRPGIPSKRPLV